MYHATDFTAWVEAVHKEGKKLVLFLDEADVFFQRASEELKALFLTTLRNWKANTYCPVV